MIASVMMLFSLISCDKKEDKIDLSSIIVAKTEHYEIDGAMYAFFLYDFVGQNSTYLPYYEEDRKYTLDHIDRLVIKDVAEDTEAQIRM